MENILKMAGHYLLEWFEVTIFISECLLKPYPTHDELSHLREARRGGWGILN